MNKDEQFNEISSRMQELNERRQVIEKERREIMDEQNQLIAKWATISTITKSEVKNGL